MRRFFQIAQLAAAALGAYLIYRVLQKNDVADIFAALRHTPARAVASAFVLTAVSYVLLSVNEYLAVRYATGRPLPFWRVALFNLGAIGIGHAVGLGALSSGAVRYRMYKRLGLRGFHVAQVVLFSGVGAALGLLSVGLIALMFNPEPLQRLFGADGDTLWEAGGLGVGAIVVYLAICYFGEGRLRRRIVGIEWSTPSFALALGQTAVGTANIATVAAVLYTCLTPFQATSYATVAALYPAAEFAAIAGHVPGGWGVLEFVMSSVIPGAGVLAGLTIFRAVYYLVPLVVGIGVFLASEAQAGSIRPRLKFGLNS